MTIRPFVSQQEETTPSSVQHDAVLQHGMEQLSMTPHVRDENSVMAELMRAEPIFTDQATASQIANVTSQGLPDRFKSSPNIEYEVESEREADETDEHFKDRILNLRAAQLFAVMKPKLSAGLELSFTEVAHRHNTKKEVAQKFYSLLLLKKQQVLKIEQNEPDVPVTICKGSRFETEAI